MNIQVQVCGMIILIILTLFYKSNRTLRLYSEKIFFRVMIFSTASLALDILSLVAIEYRNILPELLVSIVCKTYLISLLWIGMSGTIYILADVLTEKTHKRLINWMIVFTCLQGLVVYALPIYIFDEGKAVYTYGTAVICVYIYVALYVAATLVILCLFHTKVSKRREFAVALWMTVWVIAAIIQFLNNEILLVGFATAVGVLILLVIMENPEANLDRHLGCFNEYALSEYISDILDRQKKFSVLSLYFADAYFLEEHRYNADDMLRKMLRNVKNKGVMAFRNASSGLVFFSEDKALLQQTGEDVLRFLEVDLEWRDNVRLALIEKADGFSSLGEWFGFLNYIHTENAGTNETIQMVDEFVAERYRMQHVIEQKITEAMMEDRVEVFLQPIYSNREKRFSTAEALVRIRERDGSFLAPGAFIPVAEKSGQILELGERVFERVCGFLRDTEAISLGIRMIEVNLSVIQCEQTDLAERLISIIERYGISPNYINFEITETASISARTILQANMKKLIEYGFEFSLDDFGKGESNLMYVVEMPVSVVKLDYDMSKAFFDSPKAKHVVRAVVGMAQEMDLSLVAEGIETKEELDSISEEGIGYIQGFYYSKPLPMPEFLKFIKENRNNG